MKQLCFFLCFAAGIFFTSCQGHYSREEPDQLVPVPYTLSEASASFSNKYISLSIDSVNNALLIFLEYAFPANAAFPVNQEFKDTLTETAFLLELKADGKTILSDYSGEHAWRNNYGSMGKMSPRSSPLICRTDTVNLASQGRACIQIPYYAFHRLKQGAHELELSVSQDVFRSNHSTEIPYYDSLFKHPSTRHILNHAAKQLVYCKAHFTLRVPPLHETVLYSNRVEIKNDSTFNPYTSDNTIWNSSLPDVYWAVFYPADNYYTASDYETSTITYTSQDTFRLYHYSVSDSIGFAVYDHDNLSRDDGLGYKLFSLKDLIKQQSLNTSFDHVKLFSIGTEYKGLVNP